MKPTIGRIVLYRVRPDDPPELRNNRAEVLPAIITAVFSDTVVNLKIFTDGSVDVWHTSRSLGSELGQWSWPKRED